ncbi:endonuclease/exonuclease/phosphatase family protein [Flexivirga caeni]|nr:endonuclease/exonuclease/phosphatase family protein [Flexivirga caeni]
MARALAWVVVACCGLVAFALTPLHWIDVSSPRLVELATFTPWGTPFAFVAVVACLALLVTHRSRRREAIAFGTASALLLALHVWWLAPLYVGPRPGTAGKPLVILSQNFEYGDPARLTELVRAEHVDVLVLTDVTNSRVKELEAAGVALTLPNSAGAATNQIMPSVVFSRFPIEEVRDGPHSSRADLIRLRTPSLGIINLIAVHPQPPYTSQWRTDYRALTAYLRHAVPQPKLQATIIAGDFNATTDNVPFRGILQLGFADALIQTRGGFHPTWPDSSARRYFGVPVPRVVTIDHILVSTQLAVSRLSTVHIPGSDHSGILADVARRAK